MASIHLIRNDPKLPQIKPVEPGSDLFQSGYWVISESKAEALKGGKIEQQDGIFAFLMPYAKDRPYRVKPARSLFIDGEIALMMGARRMLQEEPAYKHQGLRLFLKSFKCCACIANRKFFHQVEEMGFIRERRQEPPIPCFRQKMDTSTRIFAVLHEPSGPSVKVE